MASQSKPSEVLLVGSAPLESALDFFTTAVRALPKQLRRIPDGETGPRSNFIAWQHPVFPITIIQPRWRGQPSAESSAKQYTLEDIKPTGYDDQAIASYAIFRELRDAGTIPAGVRFQVSLPTPFSVVRGFVEDDGVCAQVEPLYEERLLRSLRRIQDSIPASDLTIQWDLPADIAALEYERHATQDKYWKPYFSPVKAGLVERLIRLAAAVDSGVEMGYHLCYGDMDHKHFVQPADTEVLVGLANAIMQNIRPIHPPAYIHMPVPKDRADEAYFKPMQNLKLDDTNLFLGLVHPNDESGTKKRLEAAQAVYPSIAGVASECGLGRGPREDVDSILGICASVTV
ncbi:MAG: hypothetical protein Q9217_003752 [Psora testacea]